MPDRTIELANRLYVAVVNPDTIWWDDLTPELQEGWLRTARAMEAEPIDIHRLAAAMADPLVGELVAGMLATQGIELDIRRPVVTNVGPDEQEQAHELAHEHARKVAGVKKES